MLHKWSPTVCHLGDWLFHKAPSLSGNQELGAFIVDLIYSSKMSVSSPQQTHPLMGYFATLKDDGYLKTPNKAGVEGTYLHRVKVCYEKPTASIILNGDKTESFSPEARSKTGMSSVTTSIPQKCQLSKKQRCKGDRTAWGHNYFVVLSNGHGIENRTA